MAFLPLELIRNVCSNLSTTDIKNVRLTCQALGDIAAEFLIPEVHVVYKTQSITRLRKISLHPIFSQHVISILYEGDRLDHYKTRKDWEKHVMDDRWRARMPKRPAHNASTRDHIMFDRAVERWAEGPRHTYTEKVLKKGWSRYKALYNEQEEIGDRNMDHRDIARAILRFPKLKTIRISNDCFVCETTPYLKKSYQDCLVMPDGEYGIEPYQPSGFRQFQSVMMGLALPEKKDPRALMSRGIALPSSMDQSKQPANIRTLHIGSVSWFIFKATPPSLMSSIHDTMRYVRDLKLVLNTGRDEHGHQGIEVDMCKPHLQKTGCLLRFLTAAPDLEKLHVEFDVMDSTWYAADLDSAVGRYTWKKLREVTFGKLYAESEKLLGFLERHKETLEYLTIEDMVLEEGALWSLVLQAIRGMKIWNQVALHGDLLVTGADDLRQWFADYPKHDQSGGTASLRVKISDYVMRQSAVNPLLIDRDSVD